MAIPAFEISLPTDEEIQASCTQRYERIRPTLIDQWPREWHEASIPTHMFALTHDDVSRIVALQDGGEPSALVVLATRLDVTMNWREKFVRLNTRSPKDVTHPGLPITNAGRQAISWLASSMRTFDDLCLLLRVEKPAFIALREPTYIDPEHEYRCFVKDGEFISVSQYFYDRCFDGLQDKATRLSIVSKVDGFWKKHIQPHTDMQNYVFDVFFDRHGPRLLEVNTYGLSDPCAAKTYEDVEKGGFFFVEREEV